MKFILGVKLGMSQIFDEKGKIIPVTFIEAGPCFVTQLKTKEKDGYEAVQVGFQEIKKNKKIKKTNKEKPFKFLREFRENPNNFKENQKIEVSIFKEGDKVKVTGISKGKGFAGAVKRWGFRGRGGSHGVKHEARTIGSVGTSFPQRVIKGKKMPGRMGSERVTVRNLRVEKVDPANNLLVLRGAVPGPKGGLVEIKSIA
jgi:large subunit ribosomal protein L3